MKEEALKLAAQLEADGPRNSAKMIRKLVAELDKQGEPVGWFINRSGIWWEVDADDREEEDIPLYTAPQTKPLSDDEIMKEWHWKYADTYEDILIKFARAIEERHGIK